MFRSKTKATNPSKISPEPTKDTDQNGIRMTVAARLKQAKQIEQKKARDKEDAVKEERRKKELSAKNHKMGPQRVGFIYRILLTEFTDHERQRFSLRGRGDPCRGGFILFHFEIE